MCRNIVTVEAPGFSPVNSRSSALGFSPGAMGPGAEAPALSIPANHRAKARCFHKSPALPLSATTFFYAAIKSE